MPRVKGGYTTRRRRKAILKLAKGYFGSKNTLYRTANSQVMRSLAYSYRDRKVNKRNFRKLWIARINAACKANDFKYSLMINGLKKAGVVINRKMLAELAIFEPTAFTELVVIAKKGLSGELKVNVAAVKAEVKMTKAPKAKKEEKPVVKAAPKAVAPKAEKEAPKVIKEAPKAEKAAVKTVDYEALKVAELRDLAKEKGITGISTMKKADLIAALTK